jgi:hypothetical protein
LNLKRDILVSSLAFKCNLYRYIEDEAVVVIQRHARGYMVRARQGRVRDREREMQRYNRLLPEMEAKAEESRRRWGCTS